MTTTMTERDKKLLYFVGLAAFLFVFVRFLFFPALEARQEAQAALETSEATRQAMELQIAQAGANAMDKENTAAELQAANALYYGLMSSDELDTLITGLELRHNLLPVSLDIGSPATQSLQGYAASYLAGQTAAPGSVAAEAADDTAETVSDAAAVGDAAADLINSAYDQASYIQTATVTLNASGDRNNFLAMLDDLAVSYPSIQLQSFSISDRTYASAEGETQTTASYTATLCVILCDKGADAQ